MQAAQNVSQNASMRNQLLNDGLGSIDVRYETPIGQEESRNHPQIQQPQPLPPNQSQYHQHQNQNQNQFNHPPPQQQRYNGYPPNQQRFDSLQSSQNPYVQTHIQPPSNSGSRSRRSSITSNNSSFNLFKKAKGKFGGSSGILHDDEDEDDKEIILDNNQANGVAFSELTSIRDRGRYGGGTSFDTTPIIPTLTSGAMIGGNGVPNGVMSNTQYRKQKTALKKQQFNQFGKFSNITGGNLADSRAGSLQSARNPYLDQQSRAGSFTNQAPPPQFNVNPGSRANSLTNNPQQQYGPRPNQPPLSNGPRAYSLTNQPQQFRQGPPGPPRFGPGQGPSQGPSQGPGQFPNNPRTNSLTNQPMQQRQPPPQQQHQAFPSNPRAYSLNTNGNPYQQQHQQHQFNQQAGPPRAQPRGYPGPVSNGPLLTNRQGPPPPSGPPNSGPSGLRNNPPPVQHRNSLPGVPSPLSRSQVNLTTAGVSQDAQNQAQPEQIQVQQTHLEPVLREESFESSTEHKSDQGIVVPKTNEKKTAEPLEKDISNHHYLADNYETDDSLTSRDVSSIGLPKGESTPSPSHNSTVNVAENQKEDATLSPSKIPRSIGLPHLSLLSLGDNSDDSDDEINKSSTALEPPSPASTLQPQHSNNNMFDPVTSSSNEFIPTVLEPVHESVQYEQSSQSEVPRAITPNLTSPPHNGMKASPRKLNLISPMRSSAASNDTRHLKNQISISSEQSIVSDSGPDLNNQHNRKLYGLASAVNQVGANNVNGSTVGGNGSGNEKFVTASQFSILGSRTDIGTVSVETNQPADQTVVENGPNRSDKHELQQEQQPQPQPQPHQQYSQSHLLPQPPQAEQKSVVEPTGRNFDKDIYNQAQLERSFQELSNGKLGDTPQEDLDKTPIVSQSNQFSKSVNTTPLNLRRMSVDSENSAAAAAGTGSKSPFSKGFKSPGFLKKWTKRKDNKKKQNDGFEQIVKPIDTSIIQSNGTFESRNLSSYSENDNVYENRNSLRQPVAFPAPVPVPIEKDEIAVAELSTTDTVIHHTLDPQPDRSHELSDFEKESINAPFEQRDRDFYNNSQIDNISGPGLSNESKVSKLGESFIPVPELPKQRLLNNDADAKPRNNSLSLTVAQLGVMEDKTDLIQELGLVSRELAASIKREIRLEEQLKSSPKTSKSFSPSSLENSSEERIKENAFHIADLTRKLNEERKIRYIAEEHVLLHENQQEPSALKLNYEVDQLKSELMYRDELINKLQSQLENFKTEIPILKEKITKLNEINEKNETVVLPNLQNEVEVLKMDRKKLSIVNEKYKSLKHEKLELERKLQNFNQSQADDFSFTSEKAAGNRSNISMKSSDSPNRLNLQRPFITASSSFDSNNDPSHKRLTFSLLNVGTADN